MPKYKQISEYFNSVDLNNKLSSQLEIMERGKRNFYFNFF